MECYFARSCTMFSAMKSTSTETSHTRLRTSVSLGTRARVLEHFLCDSSETILRSIEPDVPFTSDCKSVRGQIFWGFFSGVDAPRGDTDSYTMFSCGLNITIQSVGGLKHTTNAWPILSPSKFAAQHPQHPSQNLSTPSVGTGSAKVRFPLWDEVP